MNGAATVIVKLQFGVVLIVNVLVPLTEGDPDALSTMFCAPEVVKVPTAL